MTVLSRTTFVHFAGIGLSVLASLMPLQVSAQVALNFKECASDSKLLNGGPTAVFGEGPGTYWGLVADGLQSAFGNDDQAKIAYLSKVFGQQFTTLDEARVYNLQSVSTAWDKYQDGHVCVFDLRGTRAYLDDPYAKYTYFGISDDKVRKKWS